MFGPIITYELGKAVQDSYLKEAEQARLIKTLEAISGPVKPKKWLWRFKIKDLFTVKEINHESIEYLNPGGR
jgi:hypothetical protein